MRASGDPPLSIVIPALDAAGTLRAALASLEEGRDAGLVREVLVVDGGSGDATVALARDGGARVLVAPRGRGLQLAVGAASATGAWLLFLHADTRLARGWSGPVGDFLAQSADRRQAAYFRLRLDDAAPAARRLEAAVRWRCRALALPYGDQGLLLPAALYRALGGFRELPLMEDVDLVRRLGRATGWCRSPPTPSPRPSAIAATAISRGRCAISAASHSISSACRRACCSGSIADAAQAACRRLPARAASGARQVAARRRHRRAGGAALLPPDQHAAAARAGARPALAPGAVGDAGPRGACALARERRRGAARAAAISGGAWRGSSRFCRRARP